MAMGSMNAIAGAQGVPTSPGTKPPGSGQGGMTNNDFLRLIVTQMQNQNPLEPTSSDQMVQSMSMMQLVSESHSMNQMMSSWAQSQGLLLGASLIGGQVTVTDPKTGVQTQGQVTGVVTSNGQVQVQVGGGNYPLSTITSVR